MLAQSFKSAVELGLTDQQLSALQKTLVLLETDRLVHVPEFEIKRFSCGTEFTSHFNMRAWGTETECGTVRCIGGTASSIGGDRFLFDGWERGNLACLFAPDRDEHGPWADITPAQAARALRSYLTTGEPNWEAALATSSEDR